MDDQQDPKVNEVKKQVDILDKYKVDMQDQIVAPFYGLHDQIDKIHVELTQLFEKKKIRLEDIYKEEMIRAKKKLDELTRQTSDAEMKKKKQQKKEELQRERQKYLEISIQSSNKCKQFKETLSKVENVTKEIESEIRFLNDQITYADKHNEKLKEELDMIKQEIYKQDPNVDLDNIEEMLQLPPQKKIHHDMSDVKKLKFEEDEDAQDDKSKQKSLNQSRQPEQPSITKEQQPSITQYQSPYSRKQLLKSCQQSYQQGQSMVEQEEIQKQKDQIQSQKDIFEKLNEFIMDPCFQDTEFERIFMDCVMKMRAKKDQRNQNVRLPQINNTSGIQNNNLSIDDKSFKLNQEQSAFTNENRINDSTLDFTNVSDFDFNDFQKRQILEDFLGRQEVKRYLYCLIFNPQQKKKQDINVIVNDDNKSSQ